MSTYLDFEKPIAELETKVAELRKLAEATPDMNVDDEASKLEARAGAYGYYSSYYHYHNSYYGEAPTNAKKLAV